MGKRKKIVSGEREVFTYMYLYDAAVLSFERIKKTRRDCMTTIFYCAFLLEAYMNHIGSRYYSANKWKNKTWNKSIVKKLEIITKTINYPLNLEDEPFKSFKPIFKFRNQLVHGKTSKLPYDTDQVFELGTPPIHPETNWEKMLQTYSTAEKLFNDTISMMEELHNAANLGHDLFFFNSWMEWEAIYIDNPESLREE